MGVALSDVSLGNPDGFEEKECVKISSFEVRVKLLPLLSRRVEVKKIVLDGLMLYLEKGADGRANWEGIGNTASGSGKKKAESPAPGGGIPVKSLIADEVAVTNGYILFTDKTSGRREEISDITLRLTDVSLENSIGVVFHAMTDGHPVSLKGGIGPIGKEPGKGKVNFDLVLEVFNQLTAELRGHLVDALAAPQFDFSLKVAPFSPRKLAATLGEEFPVKTANPEALSKLALDINLKGNPENILVPDGLLTLDDSVLRFTAGVKTPEKPDIILHLELDKIRLDSYLPPSSEKVQESGAAPPPVRKEEKKNDYAFLRRLALNADMHVGELIARGVKMRNAEAKVVGRNGLFNLDPFSFSLYEGDVAATGKFDVRGRMPETSVNVNVAGVQAGPLLRDSVQKDILEGTVEAVLALSLRGDNPETVKRTLNGKGNLVFREGAIVGIDIVGMARNIGSALTGGGATAKKPRTDFTELRIPYTLSNGVFHISGAQLASPLLRVTAQGDADIVRETLNMKLQPRIVGTLKGQGDDKKRAGLTLPVIIGGTFKKPTFRPDMEAVIESEALQKTLSNVLGASGSGNEKTEASGKKAPSLEEQGKALLKGFGFGGKN